jgi:hypothetical protein
MQPSEMPLHLPREIVSEVLKAGYGGAVDRRRQASGEDDAVVLSSLSVERSATRTKSAGLQLGEFVAAAGLAEANRDLVTDQFATAAGENWRPIGQARSILLAFVGGEPSDAAAVWKHAATDGCAAAADSVGWLAKQVG